MNKTGDARFDKRDEQYFRIHWNNIFTDGYNYNQFEMVVNALKKAKTIGKGYADWLIDHLAIEHGSDLNGVRLFDYVVRIGIKDKLNQLTDEQREEANKMIAEEETLEGKFTLLSLKYGI